MSKRVGEREMADIREIKLGVEKFEAMLAGSNPAVRGGILGQLTARYFSKYPPDAQPHIKELFAGMVNAALEDLNKGVDRMQMEAFVHIPDETVEAMELAAAINAATDQIKNAMARFVSGEFGTLQEAMESLGMQARVMEPGEAEDIGLDDMMKTRSDRMN